MKKYAIVIILYFQNVAAFSEITAGKTTTHTPARYSESQRLEAYRKELLFPEINLGTLITVYSIYKNVQTLTYKPNSIFSNWAASLITATSVCAFLTQLYYGQTIIEKNTNLKDPKNPRLKNNFVSSFLHLNILHLTANLVTLWSLNNRLINHDQKHMLALLLSAGFMSNVVSEKIHGPGIGTSGMVFSLLGACQGILWNRGDVTSKEILEILAINFFHEKAMSWFTGTKIAHATHLIGYLVGFSLAGLNS